MLPGRRCFQIWRQRINPCYVQVCVIDLVLPTELEAKVIGKVIHHLHLLMVGLHQAFPLYQPKCQ